MDDHLVTVLFFPFSVFTPSPLIMKPKNEGFVQGCLQYAKKQDQQIHHNESLIYGVHSICFCLTFTVMDLAAWLSRFPARCYLKDLENG